MAQIAVITLLINARHMVYGLSLLDRYAACRRFKAYLVYALTDETYGILTTVPPPDGSDQSPSIPRVGTRPELLGARQLRRLPRRRLLPDSTAQRPGLRLDRPSSCSSSSRPGPSGRARPTSWRAIASGGALLLVGPANFLVVAILASIVGILPFRKVLS